MPTLSIIIPAYNAEKYLEDAVNSIICQPCSDVEVIIVNDGSKDRTFHIAERLEKEHRNIRVINIENSGVSVARNIGIKSAKGKYIGFLDSDDVWCKDAYTQRYKELLDSGKHDMIGFGYFQTDESLKYGKTYPEADRVLLHEDAEYNLYYSRQKPFFSYFFNRALLKQVKFPEGSRYGEDISFLFWATRLSKDILLCNHYLMMYRTNCNSIMYHTDDFNFMLETINALYKTKEMIDDKNIRLDFDSRIHKMMYEYLRLSSKNGTPYKKVYKEFMQCSAFFETWENLGNYDAAPETTEYIKLYMENPRKAWGMMRRKGILRYTIRNYVRKSIFRPLFFRLKFNCNVKNIGFD